MVSSSQSIHTMFPVKGWSVSAAKLKVEVDPQEAARSERIHAPPREPHTRKRKRPSKGPQTVTSANLSDLWEKVIEHKKPVEKPKKATDTDGVEGEGPTDEATTTTKPTDEERNGVDEASPDAAAEPEKPRRDRTKKKKLNFVEAPLTPEQI